MSSSFTLLRSSSNRASTTRRSAFRLRPDQQAVFRAPSQRTGNNFNLNPARPGKRSSLLLPPISAAPAAAAIAAPVAAAVAVEPLGQLLLGIAALVASVVAGIFVVVCLPSIVAAARALRETELLLRTLRKELPDTLAVLRLSGMELADVLQEFGGLGGDLTGGIRASARAVIAAEQGVKDGGRVVKEQVLPAAVNVVEDRLKQTSKLQHTAQVLSATKGALQRTRFALGTLAAASQAVTLAAATRNLRGGDAGEEQGAGLPAPPTPAVDSV